LQGDFIMAKKAGGQTFAEQPDWCDDHELHVHPRGAVSAK
jgi:hypothetical protein